MNFGELLGWIWSEDENRWWNKFDVFFGNHAITILFVHFTVSVIMIWSGPKLLEPYAASLFWAPVVAYILVPKLDCGPFTRWSMHHRIFLFVGGWILGAAVIPGILSIWDIPQFVDSYLHNLRETIASLLGLNSQMQLLLIPWSVWAIGVLIYEVRWRFARRPRSLARSF